MKPAVVIPLYREQPGRFEEISLRQCARVLAANYPVYIVAPDGLPLGRYGALFGEEGRPLCGTACFAPHFFESIAGYNSLMLQPSFYETFKDYDYILIHQPDAFVFYDALDYFCNLGYDYIGAPWFKRFFGKNYSNRFSGAGNGGFSLRRVSACLDVLNYKGSFLPWSELLSTNNSPLVKWKKLSPERRKTIRFGLNTDFFTQVNSRTEDYFWALDVPAAGLPFRVAPPDVAMQFAFEQKPKFLFERMGKLPFGCHAWQRYEFETFWKPVIERYGYKF